MYMPPSEADTHGYECISKHPKSTKFGSQNTISEFWDSEEQLVLWRKKWADVINRYLEQHGHDTRIDHCSQQFTRKLQQGHWRKMALFLTAVS